MLKNPNTSVGEHWLDGFLCKYKSNASVQFTLEEKSISISELYSIQLSVGLSLASMRLIHKLEQYSEDNVMLKG